MESMSCDRGDFLTVIVNRFYKGNLINLANKLNGHN